jgi:hypothetical protein
MPLPHSGVVGALVSSILSSTPYGVQQPSPLGAFLRTVPKKVRVVFSTKDPRS